MYSQGVFVMKKSEQYFTAGELASLTGISKQLLFHYDKNKILCPELVDHENNYRYYSLSQYFTLDMIITLRKLDVSLREITKYLQCKNSQDLKQLYLRKQEEYNKKIAMLTEYQQDIAKRVKKLEKLEQLRLDQIFLQEEDTENFYVSNYVELKAPTKKRVAVLAEHLKQFLTTEILDEGFAGYVVAANEILADTGISRYKVFSRIKKVADDKNLHRKSKGLFLVLYTRICGNLAEELRGKIKKFLANNRLYLLDCAYIEFYQNYWTTDTHAEYISKISIQVEYL